MYHNIPQELQLLPQWVCAGADKIPIDPRNGRAASVTDPNTWGTFADALRSGYKSIGFVLTKDDPYTIIDLDDPTVIKERGVTRSNDNAEEVTTLTKRHAKIVNAFDSYTELSQSGKGIHIVVKGSIPIGVRRDKVEVYSDSRYMIFTGNILNSNPIEDRQDLLDVLYKEMSPEIREVDNDLVQRDGAVSDEDIAMMASDAVNGEKFNELWAGKWEGVYPSQSEADLALLSIIAFYTRDNEQVRRMFRMSSLGKRDKAVRNDKYLDFALRKIRAKEVPDVDLSSVLAPAVISTPEPTPETQENEGEADAVGVDEGEAPPLPTLPNAPGLIGELTEYIYRSSIRPVREISLVAALGLTAGIAGRSYNVSGTGLNQYLILLGKTGCGKEGIATGIDHLISAIRPQIPMADRFIGPGVFASGQALIRALDDRQCFVSVLGEFGLTLQNICSPTADSTLRTLKKVLLDVYGKSGFHKMLHPSAYSDKEKNTRLIQAPNVTLIGESTPEAFYDGLSQAHIAEGLIPRFTIVEYTGPRPPRNTNPFFPPDEELLNRLCEFVTIALTTSSNNTCAPIQIDSKAERVLNDFDVHCDMQINKEGADVSSHLWNRGHLKALKLSGLIAAGCDPHNPIIRVEHVDFTLAVIRRDIETMIARFADGKVGVGEHTQEAEIRYAIDEYLKLPVDNRVHQYRVPKALATEGKVVPYSYLRRRLRLRSCFKNDRRGVNLALNMALEDMVRSGALVKLSANQLWEKYKVRSDCYTFGESW